MARCVRNHAGKTNPPRLGAGSDEVDHNQYNDCRFGRFCQGICFPELGSRQGFHCKSQGAVSLKLRYHPPPPPPPPRMGTLRADDSNPTPAQFKVSTEFRSRHSAENGHCRAQISRKFPLGVPVRCCGWDPGGRGREPARHLLKRSRILSLTGTIPISTTARSALGQPTFSHRFLQELRASNVGTRMAKRPSLGA